MWQYNVEGNVEKFLQISICSSFVLILFPFRNATGTKKENVASSYISVMPKVEGFFFSLMHASY